MMAVGGHGRSCVLPRGNLVSALIALGKNRDPEGREQGRALLCRQAARKFDDDAPERLAQVGDWIIECGTAAEAMRPPSPGRRAFRPLAPSTFAGALRAVRRGAAIGGGEVRPRRLAAGSHRSTGGHVRRAGAPGSVAAAPGGTRGGGMK